MYLGRAPPPGPSAHRDGARGNRVPIVRAPQTALGWAFVVVAGVVAWPVVNLVLIDSLALVYDGLGIRVTGIAVYTAIALWLAVLVGAIVRLTRDRPRV